MATSVKTISPKYYLVPSGLDHNMVQFLTAYQPQLKREKAKKMEVRKLTTESTICLEATVYGCDW